MSKMFGAVGAGAKSKCMPSSEGIYCIFEEDKNLNEKSNIQVENETLSQSWQDLNLQSSDS